MMYPTPQQCKLIVDCVAGITLLQAALLGVFIAYVLWGASRRG